MEPAGIRFAHGSAAYVAVSALAVAVAFSTAANAAAVKKVRVGEHAGSTRVVLDLTGPASSQVALAPDGRTLYVDLPGTDWQDGKPKNLPKSPLLAGYAAEPLAGGGTRLTISGKQPLALKNSLKLAPAEGYGHRLVFDVAAGTAPPVVAMPMNPQAMAPAAAPAAAQPGEIALTPHISTLGLGSDLSYRVNDLVAVRASGSYFRIDRDADISGINYNVEGKLQNFGLLADVYPVSGFGFHVSAGAYANFNEGTLSATPTTNVTIGNATYTPGQVGSLSGKANFNRFAPYLGLGWKGSFGVPNLMVGFDVGAMYQGKANVSLNATGAASDPSLAADLERERKSVEDDLNNLQFYPVATLSVGYKF